MHFGGIDFKEVAAVAHRDFFPREMPASVHGRIGLRHEEILLAISGKIFDLVRHAALFDLPIGCLDKTKLIDARESAHLADQANVRAFWRLDRTKAAVMGRMNVAHLKSGTLPTETSRTESRQTPLVRQFCERIRLIHELRKLRPAKEIPDNRTERFWINELLRCHPIDIDVEQRHAFFDQPLRASKTHAALIGE